MADDDKSDEVLNRVDALMRRHRAAPKSDADIPLLTDTISEPDVPLLTDVAPNTMPASSVTTSLEESVYRKLKQELDRELRAGTLSPQAAAALDLALHRVSAGLQDDIQRIIRSTIEQVLHERNAGSGIMPTSSANTPKSK